MASYYSYFQYAPDIAGDERISFGLITFDQSGCCVSFLQDWSRVEAFALRDIAYLHDFQRTVTERPPTEEEIHKMARNWANTIRVTMPRASLLQKEELLERMLEHGLTNPREKGFRIAVTPL